MEEHVRQQWEEGNRRLEAEAADPLRYRRLLAQLEVVTEELRRRVGQTYTLGQLAEAYSHADRWTHEAIAANAPTPGWPRDVAMVEDAAFHLYARGAVDYAP